MNDYRPRFYERYHTAIGAAHPLGPDHYEACARQYRGRWSHLLPAEKSSPMLDLGCGCGEYLYFLRSLGYSNLYGVDLCDGELDHARNVGLSNVTKASALDYLQDKKEAFSVISAFNLFEHLHKHEIIRLLDLIHRALRPGGVLFTITPNGLSPFGGATRYWDFSHETGFTPAMWRQLARLTGFSDIRFEEYGPIPHSALGMVRSILWTFVRLVMKGVSYIEVGGPRDISRVYTADMKAILSK